MLLKELVSVKEIDQNTNWFILIQKYITVLILSMYPFIEFYMNSIYLYTGVSRSIVYLIIFSALIPLKISIVKTTIIKFKYYFIIVGMFIISLAWTTEYTRAIFFIFALGAPPFIGMNIYINKIIDSCLLAFSSSVFIFSFLLDIKLLMLFTDEYIQIGNRFGYIHGNYFFLDPNWLGVWLSIAVIYFIAKSFGYFPFTNNNKKTHRIFYLILAIIGVYYILKTSSRSSIIALVISLVTVINFSKFKLKQYIQFFSAILLVAIFIIKSNVDIGFLERLRNTNLKEDSRIILLDKSYEAFTDSPLRILIGYGAGGGDKAIGKFYKDSILHEDNIMRYNNHNTYIDIILQLGIIGIVILIWSVKYLYSKLKSARLETHRFQIMILSFSIVQALFYNPVKNGFYLIPISVIMSLELLIQSNKKITSKE